MATTFMVFYIDQRILIPQKRIQQFVMFMVDHLFKLSEILLNYQEQKGNSSKHFILCFDETCVNSSRSAFATSTFQLPVGHLNRKLAVLP